MSKKKNPFKCIIARISIAEASLGNARGALIDALHDRLMVMLPNKAEKALTQALTNESNTGLINIANGDRIIVLGQHRACHHDFVRTECHGDGFWGKDTEASRDYRYLADRLILMSGFSSVTVCHVDWVQTYRERNPRNCEYRTHVTHDVEYKVASTPGAAKREGE